MMDGQTIISAVTLVLVAFSTYLLLKERKQHH